MSETPKDQTPQEPRPDYTSVDAYVAGDGTPVPATPAGATVATIPWDQPATMIDLEGRTPIIATIRECALHFSLYKPHARDQARIVLTKPVHREGRKTRTWILEPFEIALLAQRLADEG
jgi:hypothetical protein